MTDRPHLTQQNAAGSRRASSSASRSAVESEVGSPASRSASSRSMSSTTTSCSRTPGPRPADHLVGGLVPLALLAAAASSTAASGPGRARRSPLLAGFFGVLAGTEAVHYSLASGLSGRRLHGAPLDPRRAHAPRSRRDALDVTAARRPPLVPRFRAAGVGSSRWRAGGRMTVLVAVHATRSDHCPRRRSGRHYRFDAIAYVVRPRPRRSRRRPRRDARGRGVHDERRAAARGLVHPLTERRHRDRRSRGGHPRRSRREAARPARLRRAALRPSRGGRERGRPEPLRLAGRPRHPRRRRVPARPRRTSIRSGSAASASRSAAR